MKTITDISKKTTEELTALLKEKRGLLRKFNFDKAGARVKNSKEGMHLRRDVARILTNLAARSHTQ